MERILLQKYFSESKGLVNFMVGSEIEPPYVLTVKKSSLLAGFFSTSKHGSRADLIRCISNLEVFEESCQNENGEGNKNEPECQSGNKGDGGDGTEESEDSKNDRDPPGDILWG